MGELRKLRAQDLLRAVKEYAAATDGDENAAWHTWNRTWEAADEGVRRDALMICATKLVEAEREVTERV